MGRAHADSRRPVIACLVRAGGRVGPVVPADARLRALRDLAQKTSMQVRIRGVVVGLAFQPDAASAGLLAELLRVPRDPYHLNRRGTVIVLAPRRAPSVHTTVLACVPAASR
jgi:hypothetical protein